MNLVFAEKWKNKIRRGSFAPAELLIAAKGEWRRTTASKTPSACLSLSLSPCKWLETG